MTRLAAVFTLCAVTCAVAAGSAFATTLVVKNERVEAQEFAKRKFVKEWRRTTNSDGLTTREVRAYCRAKQTYWVCAIRTKDSACQGKMRVYGRSDNFTAPTRNMKVACAAGVATPFEDEDITPPQT